MKLQLQENMFLLEYLILVHKLTFTLWFKIGLKFNQQDRPFLRM